MFRFHRIIRSILVSLSALVAAPSYASDPLVEVFFWGEISSAANKGVQNYQRLHSELGLMRAEISRLTEELKSCGGCDRRKVEEELRSWENTYNSYQNFTGTVLAQMGYDSNVMRFFGVDSPGSFSSLQATGRKDYIDIDALPDPEWLVSAGALCRHVYEQWKECSKAWQDAGRRPANMCEDPDRLKGYCAKGDVSGAEAYISMLNLRRAGIPIPEVTDLSHSLIVDYGVTTSDVTPKVPLGWQMYDYFMKNRNRRTIFFTLDRPGFSGLLTKASYDRFGPSDLRGYRDKCMSSGREKLESCARLHSYRHSLKEGGYIGAPLLKCSYSRKNAGAVNKVTFWLYRKPEFSGLAASFDRDFKNMPAVNFCPNTYRDAKALRRGRLSTSRYDKINYTVDIRSLRDLEQLPSEIEYTPLAVATRIAGYAESIEAFGFTESALDAETVRREQERENSERIAARKLERKERKENGAEKDQANKKKLGQQKGQAAAGPESPEAINLRMDVSGFSLGTSRSDFEAMLPSMLGAIQAKAEIKNASRNELFRDNIHIVSEDGSLYIFAFDGDGKSSVLIGALRVSAATKSKELLAAFLDKYQQWDPDVDGSKDSLVYLYGVTAGDARCTAQHSNVAGRGYTRLAGTETPLKEAIVTKTALSVQFHEATARGWEDCSQAMRTKFFKGYFVTTVVDMGLALSTFRNRLAGQAKPEMPDL